MRILVLGGTGEARALAAQLLAAGVDVTSSLAGRVSNPALPAGAVRIGGFGGAVGLAAYLREHRPDAVVDATHPFAATITANAAAACVTADLPLLVLRRPGWTERPGDDWRRVTSVAAAADLVRRTEPGTVLLTTGRRDVTAFADDDTHHYVIRSVDPPEVRLPPRREILLDRGPYDFARERALFVDRDVRLLVTKDSGGTLTVAKLDVARELGVPVVMVDRPPLPAGVELLATVDDVLSRLGIAAG